MSTILRQHQTRLYGYIHSLVRDLNDADDLFQQTTLILWKKFGEFDRQRSFFAWACGIARLEVANFLRSRGRQRLYFSDDLNLLLIEAQAELAQRGAGRPPRRPGRCVEKLRRARPGVARRVLRRAPTASTRGGRPAAAAPPQSVYNSLRRIRRALFECIGPHAGPRVQAGVDVMNEPDAVPEPLQDLIDDYLDGLLDEAGTAELEELLAARRRRPGEHFVRYARLHTDLHLEPRARPGRVSGALDQIGQTSCRRTTRRGPPAAGRLAAVLPVGSAAARSLAAAASCCWLSGPGGWLARAGHERRARAAIAWLVNAQNCQWADGEDPAATCRPARS